MPLPIVIDVGVTDPPRELTNVLVEACSQAAIESPCHLMREAPEGPYAAIAIVTWEGTDRVRIEVGLRRETGAEWRSRLITFQPADLELERYRSVGFVVGTLTTGAQDEQPAKPAPAPAVEPAPPAPVAPLVPPPARPKEPPSSDAARGFVGLTGLVGAGLDEGGPRFGGNLRAGIRAIERLAVLVSAGAAVRARDDNGLSLTWIDAGLGLGYALGQPARAHAELRLEFIAERFTADARTESRTDTHGRTQLAARLGADGVWMLSGVFGVVAGVEATFRPSKTHLKVDDVEVGSTLVVDPAGTLGVRFEL
jgi:hypothetical protein